MSAFIRSISHVHQSLLYIYVDRERDAERDPLLRSRERRWPEIVLRDTGSGASNMKAGSSEAAGTSDSRRGGAAGHSQNPVVIGEDLEWWSAEKVGC